MDMSKEELIELRDIFRNVANLYDEAIELTDKLDNKEISDESFEKQFTLLAGKLVLSISKMNSLS